MEVKLERGWAKSPELPHRQYMYDNEIVCLKVEGLYSLKIGFNWVLMNKKRLSTINRYLKEREYETVFVEDKEAKA